MGTKVQWRGFVQDARATGRRQELTADDFPSHLAPQLLLLACELKKASHREISCG